MNKIKTAQITTGIGGEYQSSIHIHNYLVSKGIRDSVIKANPDKMFSFKFFDEGLLSKRFLTRIKIESDNIDIIFLHCYYNFSWILVLLYLKIILHKKTIIFFRGPQGKNNLFRKAYFNIRRFFLLNFAILLGNRIVFLTNNQMHIYSKICLFNYLFK